MRSHTLEFLTLLPAKKFDPDGDYIRQFIPEIARLPTKYLFALLEAPWEVLRESGIF